MPRAYCSPLRTEQALATRRKVLDAARDRFLESGWTGTTVKAIAEAAGVAVPTVYAIFGSKRAVLSALIDEALRGDHSAADLQDWWVESLRHPDQPERARRLVAMVSVAFPRVAPFERVVREAAGADEEIASLARDLLTWRRATTARLVDVLAGEDGLRPGLGREEAADLLFALAGPEVHYLLVEVRGWSPKQYGAHLTALVDGLIVSDQRKPLRRRS